MPINIFTVVKIILLSIFLSACGGGGSDKTTSASSQSSSSSLGNISSSSSVNSKTIQITAWIGAEDTLVNFSEDADGFEFYRSTDVNCDLTTYASCDNGQLDILDGFTLVDTTTNLNQTGYYFLKDDLLSSMLSINAAEDGARFTARIGFEFITFNNKMFVIGGLIQLNEGFKNDIWTSTDGITWIQEVSDAQFPARFNHKVVKFKNKLWLIGGVNQNGYLNDVWSSEDGINWVEVTDDVPFPSRTAAQLIDYKNKLWLIGGIENNNTFKNDIWSTEDGKHWKRETSSAAFSPRRGHTITIFNNQLWLIGGYAEGVNIGDEVNGVKNDIWSSSDGINWTKKQLKAEFSPRSSHQTVSYNNKLWVIGGAREYDFFKEKINDIWSSLDGINWSIENEKTPFPALDILAVNFKNQLWVINSWNNWPHQNNIMSSTDGISWDSKTNNPQFLARYESMFIKHNGTFWLIGGARGDGGNGNYIEAPDDVWSSVDGINWIQKSVSATSKQSGLEPRLISFNGKLWLISGYWGSSYKMDIWSSIDGKSWTREVQETPFSERSDYQLFSYENKLWMIGGADINNRQLNDIWSSVDGVHWVLETEHAAFSPRSRHTVLLHNGKLLMIGEHYDVWSSTNGVDWIQESTNLEWGVLDGTIVSFKGKLWMFKSSSGGQQDSIKVLISTDGNTWTSPQGIPDLPRRSSFSMNAFEDGIFLIGGSEGGEYKGDVWFSADGVNWRKGFRGTFEFTQ